MRGHEKGLGSRWSPGPSADRANRRSLPLGRETSLVDLLHRGFEEEADRTAFVFLEDGETGAVSLTAGDLDRRARAVAAMLQARHAFGDRALLLYPSGPDFVAAYLGCLYAGVIPTPCYPPARKRSDGRLARIASDAAARWALTTDRVMTGLDRRLERADRLKGLQWVSTSRIDEAEADAWRRPDISLDAVALLQYTSGSTSEPRGVMVTHQHLLDSVRDFNVGWGHPRESVMVTWLPIFHDLGLVYGLLQPLIDRFLCVMMPPAAFLQSPVRWLRTISRYKATHSAAPNFAYDLCAARVTADQKRDLDLRSWRIALNAAEPVRADTLDRFARTFQACGFDRRALSPGYGLAEATLKVTTNPADRHATVLHLDASELARHRVSILPPAGTAASAVLVGCGRPVPETTVRIVDPETCTAAAPGSVGEIWVGGRTVAKGYWKREKANEQTFRARIASAGVDDGPFLRTGDLGFLHDGELFLTGRLKDIVIIHGLNYYPQDIERSVEECHPALCVTGCAAFAVEPVGSDGGDRLVVAVEVDRMHVRRIVTADVFAAIRQAVSEAHGLSLHAIVLLKPKTLHKTSSAKVRRHSCRAAFLANELDAIACWRAERLAAPAVAGDMRPAGAPRRETDIREWLIQRFAARANMPADAMDPRASIASYGLDSVDAIGLAGDLETWLGRPVSPTLAFDHATIDALARHVADADAAAVVNIARDIDDKGRSGCAIAVVGLGCRLPGARNPQEFWRLLQAGLDAVGDLPAWRSEMMRWRDAVYGSVGGFLPDVELFDPGFFGIAPHEAERIDPQQRLLLEVGWEALEDAGIGADRLGGSDTGVFVGVSNSDYARLLEESTAGDIHPSAGGAPGVAANRLSYVLDLRGPSLAVDTGCSSALVAVALATQSLRRGECRIALAGGVNIVLSPDPAKGGTLAADGRCKAFDASADGYVRGEGVGIVVLKRLEDAERDGDRVVAVVRGVAVNQEGQTAGLTSPNGRAQQTVIRAALADAGIAPARVGYVEAHGAGTALGDSTEVRALQAVLLEGRRSDRICRVGSVKTNIGHLESAAGIAGFIKAALAIAHREIPPSLHYREANPRIEIAGTPIQIATRCERWEADEPLVAGVSSFGFGGTNAHVILEEHAPSAAAARTATPPSSPVQLLALSARDREGLAEVARQYASVLRVRPGNEFADICFTAATGRSAMRERLAVVSASREEALQALVAWDCASAEARPSTASVCAGTVDGSRAAGVVFLFTGQGAQYARMGAELYRTEPVFRASLDACAEVLRPRLRVSLVDLIVGDRPGALHDTAVVQPALFALEYALACLWRSWGVEPIAVLGHGVGEYVAACVAGVMDLTTGLTLIAERARLIAALPRAGRMVAVAAPEAVVVAIARDNADQLAVAAVDTPDHVVLSGATAAVDAAVTHLTRAGVACTPLPGSYAFHSPLMAPVLAPFRAAVARAPLQRASLPFVSALTGARADTEVADPGYWVSHVQAPVRFAAGITALHDAGHRVFVEIGPHPTLVRFARSCLSESACTWVGSLHRNEPSQRQMLTGLGVLWTRGIPVDWNGVNAGRSRRKVALPTYPFRRTRCWPPQVRARVSSRSTAAGGHPLLGRRLLLATAGDEIIFESRISSPAPAWTDTPRGSEAAVVLPGAYVEMAIAAMPAGGGSWLLEHINFAQPLHLTENEPRVIQTILSPDGPDAWSWRIFSRSEEQGEWTVHATGRVKQPDALATARADDATAAWMMQSGEFHEASTTIRLPDRETHGAAAAGVIDPIVMRVIFQMAVSLVPEAPTAAPYVVAGIDRLQTFERPEPAFTCHARRRTGTGDGFEVDVRLAGADGRLVAEIDGISLLAADRVELHSCLQGTRAVAIRRLASAVVEP